MVIEAETVCGWTGELGLVAALDEVAGFGGCWAAVPVPAGVPALTSVVGAASGLSGVGEVAAVVPVAAGLGAVGGFGGAGRSGLIPPSQAGPVYISGVNPLVFHFSSKSAAALFGVSPFPMTSFQG